MQSAFHHARHKAQRQMPADKLRGHRGSAAPATPQTKINHRSSAILHRLDAAMAASGVARSPVLRSTVAPAAIQCIAQQQPRYVTGCQ